MEHIKNYIVGNKPVILKNGRKYLSDGFERAELISERKEHGHKNQRYYKRVQNHRNDFAYLHFSAFQKEVRRADYKNHVAYQSCRAEEVGEKILCIRGRRSRNERTRYIRRIRQFGHGMADADH